MEKVKEEIAEIAILEMLGEDAAKRMEKLKDEYGRGDLEKAVKASGFECILKHYL